MTYTPAHPSRPARPLPRNTQLTETLARPLAPYAALLPIQSLTEIAATQANTLLTEAQAALAAYPLTEQLERVLHVFFGAQFEDGEYIEAAAGQIAATLLRRNIIIPRDGITPPHTP